MPLTTIPLRIFNDNYAYLLTAGAGNRAAVIDPGSADPIIKVLNQKGLSLSHILLTHHHFDHSGGAAALKQHYPEAKIAIHADDARHLPIACDVKLSDNDTILFGDLPIKIIHLPCHTRGHVAFQIGNTLFTGDTLFNAGCGNFFEGTAAEMLKNLQHLKTLPPTTEIYCGHEYTIENLENAHRAAPDNREATNRLTAARTAAAAGSFLVPTTLETELNTNPFLQLDHKNLQKQLKTNNEIDTIVALYQIYYGETPGA